jgi:hypothetical protein
MRAKKKKFSVGFLLEGYIRAEVEAVDAFRAFDAAQKLADQAGPLFGSFGLRVIADNVGIEEVEEQP